MTQPQQARCGYVAIVGRPNVGKSTLLNALIGQKLSITSHKPQTTRHQILGISHHEAGQLVFIDTPGLHTETGGNAMNRYMNRVARAVIEDVDAVLWMLDARSFENDDEAIGQRLASASPPLVCALNKVDLVSDKAALLPLAQRLQDQYNPAALMMISALKDQGLAALRQRLVELMPMSRPQFSEDELTDRSERFIAAEFIREQVVRRLHQELPYATTVEIEQFGRDGGLLRIAAVIWVEREGQKGILIGKGGASLKGIGSAARRSLESFFGGKVFLELWVKVKKGWSDDERALHRLGYME